MADYSLDVFYKESKFDSQANSVKADIKEDLSINAEDVIYVDSYSLTLNVPEEKVRELAENIFIDPITQDFSLNNPYEKKGYWVLEVHFHEDVTDNMALTAQEAISDYLKRKLEETEKISWIRKYLIKGNLKEKDLEKICSGLLANEIIETYNYKKVLL